MNIHIRKCNIEDLSALQELAYQTFEATFRDLTSPSNMNAYLKKAFNKEQVKKELLNPSSTFFFLYVNNQLAGYIKMNVNDAQTDVVDSNSLEIERIYIRKEYQGMGLGKILINKAIKIAKNTGKTLVWLGVWEKNLEAIAFYKKMGFKERGTHPFYMGDEELSDYIMIKTLN
ncbi:GNAT family N-acetyltransferase [Thermoflavimicrobium daqui]|uniref:GNAT family N-acetyltransferase n=1 Tax=Thermoflavimicrobium daqui TaxID=2137476 RepID=A0A364K443_9BACL|nr:GNAT family N-acetyltransferase [Thermoflavimicrobium daqui]RAL24107.1 GNAT family N-acetyltransferase [Thermoflavimicrobium daqui]